MNDRAIVGAGVTRAAALLILMVGALPASSQAEASIQSASASDDAAVREWTAQRTLPVIAPAQRPTMTLEELDRHPVREIGAFQSEAAALDARRAADLPAGTFATAFVGTRFVAIADDGRVFELVPLAPSSALVQSGRGQRPPQRPLMQRQPGEPE